MPVPTYDQFIEPLLRHLARHPDAVRATDVYAAMADHFHLTGAERDEMLPSGQQTVYQNRIGWAHDPTPRSAVGLLDGCGSIRTM